MPEVNYVPNPASPWIAPTVYYGHTTASGDGDPNTIAVIGWPGDKYLDKLTGDRYTKESGDGTTTGWTNDGSAVSGVGISGSGSPESVVTADPGTTYWDATNNIFYVKDSGTGTNTGWREIIA
jgi:hypothetical protein